MNTILSAGARQIDLSAPVCMGIINVTPDSFSDGDQLGAIASGAFTVDVDQALRRAEQMLRDGAHILDIGGESTRPGASAISDQEQLDRVLPVIEAIRRNLDVCISVDTSSATVMRAATSAGAEMINDVRALTADQALAAAGESEAALCLMHMQGQPGTMQDNIQYQDVVAEVLGFLQDRVAACRAHGIGEQRLLVDPGFGFGKSVAQNYLLLKYLARFAALDLPLMVGISRKSMIGTVVDRPVDQRLPGSIAATVLALAGDARVIRTHDVAATVDAIRVHCAFKNA